MTKPDMTVGSKPWAAQTICEYYCGEGRPMRLSDGTATITYACPRCRINDFVLNLALGTVRCGRRGCTPEVEYLEYVAVMEGMNFRTQRRQVQDKRREIIQGARDARAATTVESREHEAVEAELGPKEAPYTPEERRAAAEYLKRQEEIAEENRRREARESRRREDEARRDAVLSRINDAKAAVTWRELAIALLQFFGILVAIYYGSAALQDFAHYSPPAPKGLEDFGVPSGRGEPDSWFVAFLRDLVGSFLPQWLVLHRFPIALGCAAGVGGVVWLDRSRHRRRAAAIEEDEYVGVYGRNDDGNILWR